MVPKIIVHCLIKNEERFIWYALKSVLPFVDEILIYDTGSQDKTLEIIRNIKSKKIILKTFPSVDALTHTSLRQQMLNETDKKKFNWLMILDGDEIWPQDQLKKVISYLKTSQDKAIVVKTKNLVGDIYHQLSDSTGQYQIQGIKGHLGLRFINLKLPNLKIKNPHGKQTYTSNSIPLQNLKTGLKLFPDIYYFHATHLLRSSKDKQTLKRSFKRKYQLGQKILKKDLPAVFFANHPANIPSVISKQTLSFFLTAFLLSPLRKLKSLLIKPQSGY